MKTNALRQLDAAKIKYEILEYSIDKESFNGGAVADLLHLDHKSCYKTIAVRHERDIYLCLVSVDDELDLKKCAKALGVKNVEPVHVKDLLKTVGYERGSVSPIGTKRVKGICFDAEAEKHEKIEISGGTMGLGILVNREEIIRYLNAKTADIAA